MRHGDRVGRHPGFSMLRTVDPDPDREDGEPDWVTDEDIEPPPWAYDDDVEPLDEAEDADPLALAGGPAAGRGDVGLSSRSRNNMRRLFASLPWELLGARPAMITLTYPGVWEAWLPDGRKWELHRRAFERRWVRRWGEPLVGVWAKEFQESGRPHLHLYVGLPEQMAAEDFNGLRERTKLRHRLERRYGRYAGRGKLPAIGGEYGGEFAMWIRTAWSEVVGTQGVDRAHHARGVDVAVMFWSDEAEQKADRAQVAEYLAREASKMRQKKPPAGFVGVGRYYGVWGGKVGFRRIEEQVALDMLVGLEVESRLTRWVNWKLHVQRRGAPPKTGMTERRRGDGITAFGLGQEHVDRLVGWSEAAAARKRARWSARGPGRSPGEITNPV